MVRLDDAEHARRDALADGVVDDAAPRQHAAMAGRAEHLGELVAAGARPVHARPVRDEAGGVGEGHHLDHGLGAVDELDQHARVHVARRGLGDVVVRHGVEIQGVVLALAGGDDGHAERAGEGDELDRGGRLVAGRAGIDDAGAFGLGLEVAADGDVGLDIEHHHVLAMADRGERHHGAGFRDGRWRR